MQKLYQFIEKNAPKIFGDVWLEYPIVIGKFLEHDLMLQSVRTYYDFDRRNLDALIPIEHEDVKLIQFNCFFDLKEIHAGVSDTKGSMMRTETIIKIVITRE